MHFAHISIKQQTCNHKACFAVILANSCQNINLGNNLTKKYNFHHTKGYYISISSASMYFEYFDQAFWCFTIKIVMIPSKLIQFTLRGCSCPVQQGSGKCFILKYHWSQTCHKYKQLLSFHHMRFPKSILQCLDTPYLQIFTKSKCLWWYCHDREYQTLHRTMCSKW